MEGLKNMMEDNVERMLNKLLPTMPHICSCNDCRLDMATYALNRLHPKYGRKLQLPEAARPTLRPDAPGGSRLPLWLSAQMGGRSSLWDTLRRSINPI